MNNMGRMINRVDWTLNTDWVETRENLQSWETEPYTYSAATEKGSRKYLKEQRRYGKCGSWLSQTFLGVFFYLLSREFNFVLTAHMTSNLLM